MRTWAVVVAVAALVASAMAAEQEGRRRREGRGGPQAGNPYLQRMDKDGGGAISREEYKGTDAVFAKLDADGDGSISPQEGAASRRYGMLILWDLVDREELFKAIDKDADGSISAEEMKAAPLAEIMAKAMAAARGAGARGGAAGMIGRLDKDGDGKLSREEFPEQFRARFDKLDANADGFVDADEMGKARGGGQAGDRRAGGMLGRFDKNGDGKVTREEFPQDKLQAFDRFDKNGDGVITADELGGGGGRRGRREKEKPDNF